MASAAPEVSTEALSAPLETAAPAAPAPKMKRQGRKKATASDLPLSKEEGEEDLKPLPEDASGFRKRKTAEGHTPVRSSSIPGMTVGDVRKSVSALWSADVLFGGVTGHCDTDNAVRVCCS